MTITSSSMISTSSSTMTTGTVPGTDNLAELAARLTGRLVRPADADYAALATPWNVAVPSHPVAVVEVADAEDVATAVRFAADHRLQVAVQLTGHGARAYDQPTLLINTGRLDEITIAAGTARVGAGARWSAVLAAAAPHGLAGLCGSAPDVGVVGYHTGGGLSPIARTFGYASDHVLAFDVVTGDGVLRRASSSENPSLFWGLRGGKGALGVVTAIEFSLLPVAEIYGGALYFDAVDLPQIAESWRVWAETLPEQGSTSLAVLRLPDAPTIPPPLAGRCTVAVRFAWVGDAADGERIAAPLAGLAPVLLGGLGTMPFTAIGSIHADPVDPMPTQERNLLLRELDPAGMAALITQVGVDSTSPQVIVELRRLGGAVGREPEHPSAVDHRDAAYTLLLIGLDVPGLGEVTAAHAEQVLTVMAPWSDGWTQPNFGSTADPARVARHYSPATLTRLATLSALYDPQGVIAAAAPIAAACRQAQSASA